MAFSKELLEEIGLTKAEINVYIALLELGSSTTGPIVEKSRASSSKIYEILEKLMQKGLVSYIIQSGTKYFEAADPKRILDYMKEKQERLVQQTKEVHSILPELELKKTLSKYKNEATIYKGMKGLETAFKELLDKSGGTNYVFVVGEMDERLNDFFKKLYVERARRGIKTKTIFSEAGRGYYESQKQTPLFEGKVIGTTHSPATINIYGTKVNIRMGTSKEVFCVMIDNKELADSFLEQFKTLWNQDVAVQQGFDAFEREWQNLFDELKPGESYDALGAAFGIPENEEKFVNFFRKLHQERIKRGIKSRLLFKPGAQKVVEKYGMQELYTKDLQSKTIPLESKFPVEIFAGKDSAILLVQKKEPITITIKNKDIASSFRQHFNHLWNQKVHTFEGFEQATSFFTHILRDLKPGEEYFVINGNYGGNVKLGEFFKSYHALRHKCGIKANLLFNQNIKPFVKDLAQTPCEVKFLPAEFQSPLQMTFYKNKLYISLWSKDPIGFLIEGREVVDAFKSYFDMLWKQAK